MGDDVQFDLAQTVRTDDGTLLPPTRVTTHERALLEGLPLLVRDTGRDLVLGETIGRGGMGLVRAADQEALGRRVAVKTLRADQRDPALALYLVREAWITGALEHPNIIPIYALGLDEAGLPMIVMKRVEGTPWSTCQKAEEHELKWHLRILIQVCRAVELAGARGVIHRDLKPDNVMIGTYGEVYVLDWGIAVSLEDDRGGRVPLARDVRGISGTPAYMAPEMVAENGQGLGLSTDVYLLGAILHELITGQPRHQGGSLQAVLLSALQSAPFDYGPDVPVELAAIARRATAVRPEDRYRDASQIREALEEFLEHDGSRQLTEQGRRRLEAWSTLESVGPPKAAEVAALYHEIRFAFQQALRAWPENAVAQAGLQSCLQRKLEYDLAQGELDSAMSVLTELGAGAAHQEAQLAELKARIEARRQELEALRALQQGRNLDLGRRTRAFLMVLIGLGGGGLPLFAAWRIHAGLPVDYSFYYLGTALKVLAGAVLVFWARDSLSRTQINRQLTAIMFLLGFVELLYRYFAEQLGRTLEQGLWVDFATYFLVATTVAITVDRRLLGCALFYVIGALLSAAAPEQIHLWLGLSHLGGSLLAAYVWRPARLRGVDPPAPASRLAA